MTLIELLVSVAIVGVLIALILPAVQMARAAARRAQCAGHLRQIGVATQNYVSLHGVWPALNLPAVKGPNGAATGGGRYGPATRLLPMLGHEPLYDAVNFVRFAKSNLSRAVKRTVMLTSVDLFLCPAEPRRPVSGFGRDSYRFNCGTAGAWLIRFIHADRTGPFIEVRTVRPADVVDGLSHTVATSERRQGDWIEDRVSDGDCLVAEPYPGSATLTRPEDDLAYCRTNTVGGEHSSQAGETWFLGTMHDTGYVHVAAPNFTQTDCSYDSQGNDGNYVDGVFTASSRHSGGVNALWLDGAVRFVSDTIDVDRWRAAGSIAGGDLP